MRSSVERKILCIGKESDMASMFSKASQKVGNVTFTTCANIDGKPVALRLTAVKVIWEPSAYGGDGTAVRKNICFTAGDEIAQAVTAMEEKLSGTVVSCLKGGTLRCKINMDKVRVFDAAKRRIEKPDLWRGWSVNAFVHVKGKWESRNSTGLSLECQDIQFLEQAAEPECLF